MRGPVVIQPERNTSATLPISSSDKSGGEKDIFLVFFICSCSFTYKRNKWVYIVFLPALFMHSLSTVLQNCHFWNAKLPLLETAPNCHSRLVYTPLLFVYLGQVFQFEYIDEWETSVSVSPFLLPTSSKYVCTISGLSIVILTRNVYFCRVNVTVWISQYGFICP